MIKLKWQIYDIIDMQLIIENQFKLNLCEININLLFNEILEIIKPQIKEKKLNFSFQIQNNDDCLLNSDPQRLNQIVNNLIQNAIKFTSVGEISLIIKEQYKFKSKIYKIIVKDTGIGISEEEQKQIKQMLKCPLFLENKTNFTLGLPISQNLVQFLFQSSKIQIPENKQGIMFKSIQNKGSKFYFYLSTSSQIIQNSKDLHFNQQTQENVYQESNTILEADGSLISAPYFFTPFQKFVIQELKVCDCNQILIVDDEIFNLKSLEMILNKLGFQSYKAFNGQEAVDLFKKYMITNKCPSCLGIELIIMDYQMPILNGIEATKIIKQLIEQYSLNDIPIIACSAFDTSQDMQEFYKAGICQYIKKPINFFIIEKLIQQYNIMK